MDYGGCDRRRTKGDLKRKRINRGYKRGGKFRVANVSEVEAPTSQRVPVKGREKKVKMGKLISGKRVEAGKGKKRRY